MALRPHELGQFGVQCQPGSGDRGVPSRARNGYFDHPHGVTPLQAAQRHVLDNLELHDATGGSLANEHDHDTRFGDWRHRAGHRTARHRADTVAAGRGSRARSISTRVCSTRVTASSRPRCRWRWHGPSFVRKSRRTCSGRSVGTTSATSAIRSIFRSGSRPARRYARPSARSRHRISSGTSTPATPRCSSASRCCAALDVTSAPVE